MTQITADDDGDSDDDNVDGDDVPNHLTTNRGSSSHRGSSEVRTGSAKHFLWKCLIAQSVGSNFIFQSTTPYRGVISNINFKATSLTL